MKKVLFAVGLTLATMAFAGTVTKVTNGAAPTEGSNDTTLGVSLLEANGCRPSVYLDAGTLVGTSAKILTHVYTPNTGWTESAAALHCSVATTKTDGGARSIYVCPDLEPLMQFGRVAISNYGLTQSTDAGTGNLRFQLECWGPTLKSGAGL